jgi:quercetin dioxygenase-like cupin family protein
VQLRLRFEGINALNHLLFNPPNTASSSSAFVEVTQTWASASRTVRCERFFLKNGRNRMRFILGFAGVLTMALVAQGADASKGVTYVGHDKVAAALQKGGPLVTAPDLTVSGSHRDKAGQVEVHDKETDVIYLVEGEATLVTGGTGVGMKSTRPGQHMGSDIKDGETHHLTKGDVIVVPAGVPHWFKEVPDSVSYYVVKVLKP